MFFCVCSLKGLQHEFHCMTLCYIMINNEPLSAGHRTQHTVLMYFDALRSSYHVVSLCTIKLWKHFPSLLTTFALYCRTTNLVIRGAMLFSVGVFLALVLNLLQVQRNVTLFPPDVISSIFSSAWWVPPCCGTASGM